MLVDSFEDAANSYLEPPLSGVVPDDGAAIGALLLVARVALENGNHNEAEAALDGLWESVRAEIAGAAAPAPPARRRAGP